MTTHLTIWKISSLLNGEELRGGLQVDTVSGLGKVNGRQEYATPEQKKALQDHIRTYTSKKHDCREAIRLVEQQLLHEYAGFLIGNQCLDFGKQDGVTEIEEAVMANQVERNLNDLLLREEMAGKIVVQRKPIYIACVSNFTNFLDLFRKTVRSLEVGIPCVVLGRSNTSQHSYRWTRLLLKLAVEAGLDPGMITFLSCPLDDIKEITRSLKSATGNLYTTCSRELAASIKAEYPNTIASTGGPNTLISMDWSEACQAAARMSATIESAGQCTALRHLIVPTDVQEQSIVNMFNDSSHVVSAVESIEASKFDGIFESHTGSAPCPSGSGYQNHPKIDAVYRITKELPPDSIPEYWRRVALDITQADIKAKLSDIVDWLNRNQPISLAVTGKTKDEAMEIGFYLWSRTGLVVNTIGVPEAPAMTCQARPQEAEVFGEFPPRSELSTFTKFPVIVPSSTPGYDSCYANGYLQQQAVKSFSPRIDSFLSDIEDIMVKGYCVTILEYLIDATEKNPKEGFGTDRTAMWGLQRPPLASNTYLESCQAWDALAPSLMLFFATNAKDQVVVVSRQDVIVGLCRKHGIACIDKVDKKSMGPGDNLKVIGEREEEFVMVGQFLTTFFPVGHIKSTQPNDDEFISRVKVLDKWLAMTE